MRLAAPMLMVAIAHWVAWGWVRQSQIVRSVSNTMSHQMAQWGVCWLMPSRMTLGNAVMRAVVHASVHANHTCGSTCRYPLQECTPSCNSVYMCRCPFSANQQSTVSRSAHSQHAVQHERASERACIRASMIASVRASVCAFVWARLVSMWHECVRAVREHARHACVKRGRMWQDVAGCGRIHHFRQRLDEQHCAHGAKQRRCEIHLEAVFNVP